ncbi:acyltransferase [Devosia sp. MC1541]|uniref:acyltransferase family protein n=1 Tax=Devosia sp. MC1541 TaxID=2725264 RepID=UPI00145D2235|nr:acyltransferase [Devosia sp. MC1541]
MGQVVKQRFAGVQGLRFIAALLVLLTHASFYVNERLDASFPVWKGGIVGVDIFFVISGFVMVWASARRDGSQVSGGEFLFKRAKRILPLYWLATSLNLLVLLALPVAVLHSGLDFASIAKSYLLIPDYNSDGRVEPLLGVGWTLYFEAFFYIVFAIALAMRVNIYAFVGSVMTAVALISLFKTSNTPPILVLLDPIVLEFFAGMLIARLIMDRRFDERIALAAIGVGFVLILSLDTMLPLAPDLLTRGLPAVAIVFGVVAADRKYGARVPSWAIVLGAASYAIYLFHPIFAPAVPFVAAKLGFNVPVLVFFGAVFVAIIVPTAIYRFIEAPSLRLIGVKV